MDNNRLAVVFGKKQGDYGNDRDPDRRYHILYRFRFLFYAGCVASVLLVALLGLVSYMQLVQLQLAVLHAGQPVGALLGIKLFVASGTGLVLVIVAFLVYIVQHELNSRDQAYQQEHELNELKSNFITLASHEFRTPLSSVLLSAALIEKYVQKQETENIAKHSLKIKQVVHRLEAILEDFLSLEKLDAGQIKANYSTFDLDGLCMDVLAETRLRGTPGQRFSYEQSGTGGIVRLDPALLRNALTNLLFNAVKYAGEQAEIRLLTTYREGLICICVKDNGLGIAKKDQAKLFTAFYRVNDSGNIPGTGLGLFIAKRYVQLMGGTLHFYSRPLEETCFEMSFPLSG